MHACVLRRHNAPERTFRSAGREPELYRVYTTEMSFIPDVPFVSARGYADSSPVSAAPRMTRFRRTVRQLTYTGVPCSGFPAELAGGAYVPALRHTLS